MDEELLILEVQNHKILYQLVDPLHGGAAMLPQTDPVGVDARQKTERSGEGRDTHPVESPVKVHV